MTSPAGPSVDNLSFRAGRKLLMGVALALTAVLFLAVFFGHQGLYQVYRFRQERLGLEQENSRLTAENDRLARTIDRLQHDPEMIQDLIRRELNFIKKNEIIFQLPPAAPSRPALPPPAGAAPEAPPPQSP